ncbi:hypothetical protein ROZALSC1DRAFT_21969 [Rozella allomycis CSF55]|uniref:TH1 domain-containing protein n=1 Tax=Rozella allomycis (strain CSF55) TaxID=988480 RepID=A0A4P9YMJ5_ROZAC|nr:hypothetical protein ROZALSC1DRAFT_21969 [Rozella allomycis CSF55]
MNGKNEKFLGVKTRRRSSVNKIWFGDHIYAMEDPKILSILSKHNEDRIEFTDYAWEITSKNKPKNRLILVSVNEKYMYVTEPTSYRIRERIPISRFETIKISQLADNFFVISIENGCDIFLQCSGKTELISRLGQLYEAQTMEKLTVLCTNRFTFRHEKKKIRKVLFEETNEDHVLIHIFD